MSQLVVLGRLGRPHGIRGEIRAEYYAESPLLLEKPLFIQAGRALPRPVKVVSWRYWQERLILKLEGVDNRSAAELLRGQELLMEGELLPEIDDDEAYLYDMLGLPVFARDGEDSARPIGVLENVLFPAGQEIWSIRAYKDGEYSLKSPQRASGHEILFPAVPEFVEDIDLAAERILITPPSGLLELYAPGHDLSPDPLGTQAQTHTRVKRSPRRKAHTEPDTPTVSGKPHKHAR